VNAKPPTPPSSSASHPSEPFKIGLQKLITIPQFWILVFEFGIGIGVFSTFTTLISYMVQPAGYSEVILFFPFIYS